MSYKETTERKTKLKILCKEKYVQIVLAVYTTTTQTCSNGHKDQVIKHEISEKSILLTKTQSSNYITFIYKKTS